MPFDLTNREIEVLQLVAHGHVNARVADTLVISPRTVEAHLRTIYQKLQVNNRCAATRLAMQYRLVN
jgi:DNA-binding NarL/FixJ family response regulator